MLKAKLESIANWKGWRWVYYFMLLMIGFLVITSFFEIFEILTKTNEQRIRQGAIPIPAQCCWEYRSKFNFVTHRIIFVFINALFLFLSFKKRNHLKKILLIASPIAFFFFLNLLFPSNI
jgi:MFS family permease